MPASHARQPISIAIGSSSRLLRARLRARNFRRSYSQQTTRIGGSRRWAGPAVALLGTFTAATAAYVLKGHQGTTEEKPSRRLEKVTFEKPKTDASVTEERNRELLSAQHAQIKKMSANPGIYIWGSNKYRVVDPDSEETIIKEPRRLRYFEGQLLRDIKLDQTSGAAVTENGDLVQWGKGYSETDFQPSRTLTGKNLIKISMSRDRIIALSSNGSVYSIPTSKIDQQSGSKPSEGSWIPGWSSKAPISYRQLAPLLSLGEKVTSITSGLEHVLLLTNAGRVFSAAAATEVYPSRGQLGVPGLTWATRPKGPVDYCHELSTLKDYKIVQIASGDFHSLLLDKDGRVFSFGDNSVGQLGFEYDPALPMIDTPTQLPINGLYSSKNWSAQVTSIAAGGYTSFITIDAVRKLLSDDASAPVKPGALSVDTWAFGRGIHGALGNGKWTHFQDTPSKLKALSGLSEYDEKTQKVQPIRPVQIAVGATHAAAVLGNNTHLTNAKKSSLADITWGQDTLWWGGNESLQVGTGKRSNVPTPIHILPPPDLVTSTNLDEARFQVIPGKQRIECGRQVTAVYSLNMPREKQKRGRRAQEKEKSEENKRKLEDDHEEPALKRQRPSTENQPEDYIPFDSGEQETDAPNAEQNDTPFYGLLDSEEQEYFSRAAEVLELNQFQTAEEQSIFVESVYEEAKGKELKIACSQSCSRLLEKIIALSNTDQLRRLFGKFLGHFLHLIQHRFASHCCETLFVKVAPALTHKTPKVAKKQIIEEEENDEPSLSLADMFLQVIAELESNWGYLMTERFASHTIRVLLLVLAGEPVDLSSHSSVVASKAKEGVEVHRVEGRDQSVSTKHHIVPDAFMDVLKKVMKDMTAGLDDTYLRALATHHIGNPVLQLLVSLELSHFGKSTGKDPRSVLRRLIPEDTVEEGTQSAIFLTGLLYDPVGSRLVETIVRSAPGKLFKNIHKNIIRERIASLSRNEIASYVLVRCLERVGKDDLQTDLELIIPEIPNLIERSRLTVPRALIERCLVRNIDTAPLAKAVAESLDKDPARRLHQLLESSTTDGSTGRTSQPSENPTQGKPKAASPVLLHKSLFVQKMLEAPGALSELVYSGLLATSTDTTISMACNSVTSHVLQKALTAPTSTTQFRRQFVPRFLGHMKQLALDTSGSHVVDALWYASKDIYFVKERLAQELADSEHDLRDSFIGRAVWKNWSMDLYKRRRGEWKGKAKGIDNQTALNNVDEKARTKSKLDLARERYDASKKSAAKIEGGRTGITMKI
ncbi:rRNA processing protein Nop9, putative [Talaromyces stipitatus ATCC 10500]|uniref:rRNA processing protein Nop9, putative n=1 Tax=Talaromyces stipitatus (strain ATCC 10500 / CBS 375.48 / QM 6759 / NRRL 1006) TaxID=441959 RepID=B8M5M4_TALSN|nr:rRNA processing protein Nop9, putative [Talaromyces stipitatus ATCC 10500]EED19918.1 rRNA processing protein Nop9, putative [Talaromyces stipitatus ATCC 10500]